MAGTKQPAEAMGFVKNKSVGERTAMGEAMTRVLVDSAVVRMSA